MNRRQPRGRIGPTVGRRRTDGSGERPPTKISFKDRSFGSDRPSARRPRDVDPTAERRRGCQQVLAAGGHGVEFVDAATFGDERHLRCIVQSAREFRRPGEVARAERDVVVDPADGRDVDRGQRQRLGLESAPPSIAGGFAPCPAAADAAAVVGHDPTRRRRHPLVLNRRLAVAAGGRQFATVGIDPAKVDVRASNGEFGRWTVGRCGSRFRAVG